MIHFLVLAMFRECSHFTHETCAEVTLWVCSWPCIFYLLWRCPIYLVTLVCFVRPTVSVVSCLWSRVLSLVLTVQGYPLAPNYQWRMRRSAILPVLFTYFNSIQFNSITIYFTTGKAWERIKTIRWRHNEMRNQHRKILHTTWMLPSHFSWYFHIPMNDYHKIWKSYGKSWTIYFQRWILPALNLHNPQSQELSDVIFIVYTTKLVKNNRLTREMSKSI